MIRSSEIGNFLTSEPVKDLPGRVYFMTSLWLVCYPGTPNMHLAPSFRCMHCIIWSWGSDGWP